MFKNINQFGYRNYSNEELMMINKKANSNVDFDKVNKLLKEQMIRESKKELELLKGSLNDFDNRIDKLYKEIRFLEKRSLLAINDEQLMKNKSLIWNAKLMKKF